MALRVRISAIAAAIMAVGMQCAFSQDGFKNSGFQCLPVPSEWMEVGSVFEVDSAGASARLGKVDSVKVLRDSLVGFPAYSTTTQLRIGVLASMLERLSNAFGWSAGLQLEFANYASVVSTYGDLKLDVTEGQPEKAAEEWFVKNGFKIERKKRYYLVREAIRAKEVSYSISSNDIARLGGEAKIKDLLKGRLDIISRTSDGGYKLSAAFENYLNVCIKPREIIATRTFSGEEIFYFRDVSDQIAVSEVRH